jgi:biopolymer transport protein ExbD
MNWSIRHEGSPRSIDGLNRAQVIEGLQDGLWEPTDEVKASQDPQWLAIENHPDFAEIAADLEPPPPPIHDDETRLDMNPLIDVALVLLIFFILTISYSRVQKVLDMPVGSTRSVEGPIIISKDQVQSLMVKVEARLEGGMPVIRVEGEPVPEENLRAALSKYAGKKKKSNVLIDAQGVSWGTVVTIQDAAKGADMEHIFFARKPTKK